MALDDYGPSSHRAKVSKSHILQSLQSLDESLPEIDENENDLFVFTGYDCRVHSAWVCRDQGGVPFHIALKSIQTRTR